MAAKITCNTRSPSAERKLLVIWQTVAKFSRQVPSLDMKYQKFKIVRSFYLTGKERVIKRNVSFSDALAHIRNPETASTTATTKRLVNYTKRVGPWYDKYLTDRVVRSRKRA